MDNHNLEKLARILNGDPRARAIVNPKENLPQDLIPTLTECGREGFNRGVSDTNTRHYVDISELLVLGYDGKEIIGYSGYQFGVLNEERYVYLCGGTLKLKAQGLNHFPKVHTEIANSGLVDLIVMRTQNPRVYAALKKVDGIKIYPRFDLSTTERIRIFAQQFSREKLNQEINPNTFVAVGTYGNCLYDKVPDHKIFSTFFTKTLRINFHRGDSVILIGEINH